MLSPEPEVSCGHIAGKNVLHVLHKAGAPTADDCRGESTHHALGIVTLPMQEVLFGCTSSESSAYMRTKEECLVHAVAAGMMSIILAKHSR